MTIPTFSQGDYDPAPVFIGGTCTVDTGGLIANRIYIVTIFTTHEPFTFQCPSLDSWTGIRFLDPDHAFTVDGVPTRFQNGSQSNPTPSQVYIGLVEWIGIPVTLTFTGFAGNAPGRCAVEFTEVVGAITTYGFAVAGDSAVSAGIVTNPLLVVTDGDTRVVRGAGVIPAALGGGVEPILMPVDYGASGNDGIVGLSEAPGGEMSVLPWTAPSRADVLEFEYDTPGNGTWIALTIAVSGDPVVAGPGWHVGMIGWGP